MKAINGDCLSVLRTFDPATIDSLVTDPPAGISFMGKAWDDDKGGRDAWVAWMREVMTECLRVLKPGAHGLVWALPRTSHWTATALEDAGFEIRDVVTHLFGSGFPKSLDVSKAIDKAAGLVRDRIPGGQGGTNSVLNSRKIGEAVSDAAISSAAKQWQGFGTALKPASEHWILVRKPLSEKTVAKNVLKWGTGALNIDASRVGFNPNSKDLRTNAKNHKGHGSSFGQTDNRSLDDLPDMGFHNSKGRFPANLVLDEEAAVLLDEQSGVSGGGKYSKSGTRNLDGPSNSMNSFNQKIKKAPDNYGDQGGASRFFYVAKASKLDKGADNTHPTVKSTKLMSYLIKLVTPPGGIVLDPFMGSGSTGVAATYENFKFVGIEKDAQYFEIAEGRIKHIPRTHEGKAVGK